MNEATKSMSEEMKSLKAEIEILKGQERDQVALTLSDLLQEFKLSRHQVGLPSFPKSDVYIAYRQWRSNERDFVLTNNLLDNLKIQHLKKQTMGTEAEKIVNLFDINECEYDNILRALDKRFLVLRVISTEYLNKILNIPKNTTGKMSLKSLKNVILSPIRTCEERTKNPDLPGPKCEK